MHVYCIDAENTSNKWGHLLKLVEPQDKILLFFSHNCKHISLSFLHAIMATGVSFELISCQPGFQAMDFQLCSELGYRIAENKAAAYVIVSEDHGYDVVVNYWRNRGIDISRLPILSTGPNWQGTTPGTKPNITPKGHGSSNSKPRFQKRPPASGKPSKALNKLNKVKAKQGNGASGEKLPDEKPSTTAPVVNEKVEKAGKRLAPNPTRKPLSDCRKVWKTELLKKRVPSNKVDKILDAMTNAFTNGSKNPKLTVYHAMVNDFGKSMGTNLYKSVEPVMSKFMAEGPMPATS